MSHYLISVPCLSDKKACYRTYLERVLDAGDVSYEEVPDILSRYDTLKGANKDLMVHVNKVGVAILIDNDVCKYVFYCY